MIKLYLERNNSVRPLVMTGILVSGILVSGRKHKENYLEGKHSKITRRK